MVNSELYNNMPQLIPKPISCGIEIKNLGGNLWT